MANFFRQMSWKLGIGWDHEDDDEDDRTWSLPLVQMYISFPTSPETAKHYFYVFTTTHFFHNHAITFNFFTTIQSLLNFLRPLSLFTITFQNHFHFLQPLSLFITTPTFPILKIKFQHHFFTTERIIYCDMSLVKGCWISSGGRLKASFTLLLFPWRIMRAGGHTTIIWGTFLGPFSQELKWLDHNQEHHTVLRSTPPGPLGITRDDYLLYISRCNIRLKKYTRYTR